MVNMEIPLELALTLFTSDKCIICYFRRGTENTEDFKTLSLYKIVEIIFSVLHGEFLIFVFLQFDAYVLYLWLCISCHR